MKNHGQKRVLVRFVIAERRTFAGCQTPRVAAIPSGWMNLVAMVPGVSLRSTPGYCLATLRVGGTPNPKGCEIVAAVSKPCGHPSLP